MNATFETIIVGIGSPTIIAFLFKNWLLKEMELRFDKKIEDYKSELQKGNIDFQIEKTEFAKKKFEQVSALYMKLLDQKKRAEDTYELIGAQSIVDIRRAFDNQMEQDRLLQNDIAMAGLYADEILIKEITNFMTLCYMMMTDVISIGEDRLSKIPSQQPYMIYKVVTCENFDDEKIVDSLNIKSKRMNASFDKITALLKNYLFVR
jgi:hypothetical protein